MSTADGRGPTDLRVEPLQMPAADLGPENPLPEFRRERDSDAYRVADGIPEEERRHIGWEIGRRVLPYRMQDGYGGDLRPRTFNAAILENGRLKAVFLPDLGGRLISLLHKPTGRELLEPVRAFRPANLALRNAWFSGGVEWNAGQFGHHCLTCSPVFAARIAGPSGEPVLRLYEWERAKCFTWQVDFMLPRDSDFLFARARIVNPTGETIPMYWWTNMAAPETARTRVLAPADTAILHTPDAGLTLRDLASAPDASFPGRAKHASELFFRVKEGRRPWIAALEPDGHGLAQVSTGRLLGRKAFYWGMNAGGRRWQHLLGGPGAAYLEIQAGLARTQLESVPMPALAEWCWTEAFGPLDCPEAAGQTDWDSAWRAADREMGARLPAATLAEADRELAACAARRPVEVLARGSGWGALERLRLAAGKQPDPIPAELEFGASGPEQAPWIALLDAGRLPEQPPDEGPGAFMVQAEWRRLIENALAAGGGDHWLSWLHLGNMRCEAFDLAGARDAWVESVRRRSNSWALRNLAWLQKRAGNAAEARRLMAEAWDRGPRPAALAIEVAASLADVADWPKLAGFIAGLPGELRAGDRIRMLEARAAIEIGDYRAAESLLAGEFALVREGETTLSDLWFMLNERRTAAQEGAVIDDEFRRRIRAQFPPPPNLDFRMSGRA